MINFLAMIGDFDLSHSKNDFDLSLSLKIKIIILKLL